MNKNISADVQCRIHCRCLMFALHSLKSKKTFVHFTVCPAESDSTGTSTVNKKKRVRFGGPLSPELFDRNLPPSTPLQKGGTPARAPTPGAGLRSVLKTPQRSESLTPQALPDLSSPTVFGASPVLAVPGNSRITSVRKHNDEEDEKVDKMVECLITFHIKLCKLDLLSVINVFFSRYACTCIDEDGINKPCC